LKVLVCATSNKAVDIIAGRVLKACPTLKKRMFRANAFLRSPDEEFQRSGVAEISSFDNESRTFSILESGQWTVVFSTLSFSSTFLDFVPSFAPDVVIIDEAGHADIPEALIPLTFSAQRRGTLTSPKIILAGDPRQLGPLTRSGVGHRHGWGQSLLQRLTDSDIYRNSVESMVNQHMVMLVDNYRSHEDILRIPNMLFYDGKLQCRADRVKSHNMIPWDALPARNCPVVVHNVRGNATREERSPSWCNLDEVAVVKSWVEAVMQERHVLAHQIGVITPYHLQKQKLKQCLPDKVQVGTVEGFQGDERRVIILSTVRTGEREDAPEAKDIAVAEQRFNLGFVANPQRMNVAITRAQALLVVVCDVLALMTDRNWRNFLRFVREKGGIINDIPTPPEDFDFEGDDGDDSDSD
jgi:helicase MOV-10